MSEWQKDWTWAVELARADIARGYRDPIRVAGSTLLGVAEELDRLRAEVERLRERGQACAKAVKAHEKQREHRKWDTEWVEALLDANAAHAAALPHAEALLTGLEETAPKEESHEV